MRWHQSTTVALALLMLWAVGGSKEKDAKKQQPFPLNLFAQATAESFIGEKECAQCHKVHAQTFNASPHALYVRDPKLPTANKVVKPVTDLGKSTLKMSRT